MDLTAIFCLLCYFVHDSFEVTEQEVLDRLFNTSNYDPAIGPFTLTGEPTEVAVDFDILTLGPVNELNMEYSMSLYFRQQWYDHRLRHDELNRSIQTNYRRLESFWVPDLFFPETKDGKVHVLTVPNFYIRIQPDGSLIYSQRISVTVACLMDLRKFPLDRQTCSFRIESYGYTSKDLLLVWSSERKFSNILSSANIPNFELTAITAHDCTTKLQTGNYPCLHANLEMKRQIGFYLTQTYIPTMLIVVLSWVSFWIDPNATPARISVGLLTVLTITTQSSGARSELPRVPYIKSIDVWMAACLVFVFAAYVEYAFVTVLSRRYKKMSSSTTTSSYFKKDTESTRSLSSDQKLFRKNVPDHKLPRRMSRSNLMVHHDLGRYVDKISRYFFPTAFAIFNICYWLYYVDFS